MGNTISESGDKSPMYTLHVHVYDSTRIATTFTLGTPTVHFGESDLTLFLNGESLERLLTVLAVLHESRMANTCQVHGDACRPVWHRHGEPFTIGANDEIVPVPR